MRFFLISLLSLCLNQLAYAEDSSVQHSVKITTTQGHTQTVEVIEHTFGRIVDTASSTLAAEIPARITSVRVDVGDQVKKGQVLATLDVTDRKLAVTTARSKVKSLQAQHSNQVKVVARYQKLNAQQFIASSMLEQAQTQEIALNKSLQAARAQLKQAQYNAHRSRIIAPFSGTIQQRFIAAGDYIGIGKPVFKLVGKDNLTAEFNIPETRSARIHIGQEVRMYRAQNSQAIIAHISEYSPAINTRNNSLKVRAHIKDAPASWYPGSSISADIVLEQHEHAVVVPENCVVLRPQGDVIYGIDGNHAQAIPVHTGVHQQGMVEITQGLAAGTSIAQTGAAFLSDKATILVVQP